MGPTNRNSRVARGLFLALILGSWLLNGCGPPGPRALLKGERLIQEGRYSEAVEKLRIATELMPKDAMAWNLLGLAYHGNQQPDEAMSAYRTALTHDHKLTAARFNLGCLLLDQNKIAPAIEELSAFTIANPSVPAGWLKLGTARLRARHLDEAERCFNLALEQQPKNAEALNCLGLVAQQRHRPMDAAMQFQKALAEEPNYGPALLNLAVLNQQSLNNKAKAVALYRQYLALQPRPADAASVEQIVRLLDPGSIPVATATTQQVAVVTPPPVRPVESPRSIAPPVVVRETNAGVIAGLRPVVRTNVSVAVLPAANSTSVAVSSPVTTVRARPPVTPPVVKPAAPVTPVAKPPVTAPTVTTVATTPPPDLQVTQISGDLVIRPAQDLNREAAASASSAVRGKPVVVGTNRLSVRSPAPEPAKEKKGFFAKLNPFKGKAKNDTPSTTPPGVVTGAVYSARGAEPARVTPDPVRTFNRYAFLSPVKPAGGDRVGADRSLQRGYTAHQAGKYSQAITEYQQAVKADPGCFEAYYNIGLAAQESRDFKRALAAYEYALAVDSSSADARYNFGLALKQAGFPMDASDQLLMLAKQTPNDVRVHLLLGNIFSQQMNQPSFARDHYERVLELEPRHPEAPRIRFWLAANP